MSEQNSRYNASGCKDETAYQAINNINQENRKLDKKAYGIIKLAKELIRFAGFDLLNRIEIVDKETGKEYR